MVIFHSGIQYFLNHWAQTMDFINKQHIVFFKIG
ncbi:Uncharacterised protein [Vibrio cholerae]|nr:Uncharacterised protein [Vibrio cholerae]